MTDIQPPHGENITGPAAHKPTWPLCVLCIGCTIVAVLGACMLGIFAALAGKSVPLLVSQNLPAIAPLLMGIVASATCAVYCLFRLINHHW